MPHQCQELGVKRTHDGNTRRLRAATLAAASGNRLWDHEGVPTTLATATTVTYLGARIRKTAADGRSGSLVASIVCIVLFRSIVTSSHDPTYYSCPGPLKKSLPTTCHELMIIVLSFVKCP